VRQDRKYEFRCPLHGFIQVDTWEREIIAQPAFQRLRRIRQLAWTDYLYPGAMHTRFEHSLGVMHVATRLYDAICERSKDILQSELAYNEVGLDRDRRLVRLAALLHDVGHGPFSHASEELFPEIPDGSGNKYEHDIHYSAEVIRQELKDAIENNPFNQANYRISANEIAALIEGSAEAGSSVFWRELISGQMDADRMDYLLRDSLHAGVQYGRFDLERMINTIVAVPYEDRAPRLGVTEGGWHAAESLILARYFMFTQVYFHRTRVAYDHHIFKALQEMLPKGKFPPPYGKTGSKRNLQQYLKWDDWRVLGLIADGKGGEHGARIATRNHYREVYHTPEVPLVEDIEKLESAKAALGGLLAAEQSAGKSWYKTGESDIPIQSERASRSIVPLSQYSSIAASIKANRQTLLYAKPEDADEARQIVDKIEGGGE